MSKSVIVIGTGAVGAAAGYHLLEAGWNVTLIDRGRFGGGCSHGNCGYVCPSHILPLAEEGAIANAARALFNPNGPFRIRPRFDPALWSWLWHFARRCNDADMLAAGHAIQPLLESSMSIYRDLVARGLLDCEWQERGILYVYRARAAFEAYAETDKILRDVFHHPAERYDGDALHRLEPALRPGLAGGWHYPSDAHLRADKLMSAWRKTLEARGAAIRENCELKSFQRRGSRITAAVTTAGAMKADAFVVAAGAWTPLLESQLGCRIPIQPGKGYSITMRRPAICPTIPMIFPETRVAVTPMHDSYRLGSTMEFAGYDASLDRSRLDLLYRGSEPYLIEPFTNEVTEEWTGWRPMTYDSLPLIGRPPGADNLLLAAGNNMIGIATSPATGRLAAELLTGGPCHIDPRPYSPMRF